MKKMMTLGEIENLYKAYMMPFELKSAKFGWARMRTMDALKPHVKRISNLREYSPEYNKFNNAKLEVLRKYANKDDEGNPITAGQGQNQYYVLSYPNEMLAKAEIEALSKSDEHKEAFETREVLDEEIKELLLQEEEIDFYQCKFENLPEDFDSYIMGIYSDIIADPE